MSDDGRRSRGDHFIGGMPRLTSSAVVFTYAASDFAGRSITVLNEKPWIGFVKVGELRMTLGAGEERNIPIPMNADYQIGLGAGVRLLGVSA